MDRAITVQKHHQIKSTIKKLQSLSLFQKEQEDNKILKKKIEEMEKNLRNMEDKFWSIYFLKHVSSHLPKEV